MTLAEAIEIICARFNEFEDTFKDRVKKALHLGVKRVLMEQQWQFLDAKTTLTVVTSTDEASGHSIFELPDDFLKEVVVWTDNHTLEYITPTEWAREQIANSATEEPSCYTLIGDELVLRAPSDGSTVYMIYTRDSDSVKFEDLPTHMKYPAVMAGVAYLAPAYVKIDERISRNDDLQAADHAYKVAVHEAHKIEMRQRGRARRIHPPEHLRMRNNYL